MLGPKIQNLLGKKIYPILVGNPLSNQQLKEVTFLRAPLFKAHEFVETLRRRYRRPVEVKDQSSMEPLRNLGAPLQFTERLRHCNQKVLPRLAASFLLLIIIAYRSSLLFSDQSRNLWFVKRFVDSRPLQFRRF